MCVCVYIGHVHKYTHTHTHTTTYTQALRAIIMHMCVLECWEEPSCIGTRLYRVCATTIYRFSFLNYVYMYNILCVLHVHL